MAQNISPISERTRTQLRSPDLIGAIAHAGSRVVYIDDETRPIAAVLPIELWQMIAKIPYYHAITESFGQPSDHTVGSGTPASRQARPTPTR